MESIKLRLGKMFPSKIRSERKVQILYIILCKFLWPTQGMFA